MCGIIAYTGRREAQPILLDGIARLEQPGIGPGRLHDADRVEAQDARRAVRRRRRPPAR